MASVYDLKPRFQNLLRPLCGAMAHAGITANQVTVAAAVLSLAEGTAIFLTHGARWALLALPAVLLVRMGLNAIDGMLAREFGQKSRLGAILNELGDVVSDTALYLPFAAIAGINPMLVAVVVAVAIVTEMTGVVAIQIGAGRRYDGPMGKSDRALWFGFLAVLMAFYPPGPVQMNWFYSAYFCLLGALGVLTVVNRARRALKDRA